MAISTLKSICIRDSVWCSHHICSCSESRIRNISCGTKEDVKT